MIKHAKMIQTQIYSNYIRVFKFLFSEHSKRFFFIFLGYIFILTLEVILNLMKQQTIDFFSSTFKDISLMDKNNNDDM